MAITYRTTGAWGAGVGRKLHSAEIDENFYDLDQRVAAIESDPPTGVGIASVTSTATTFTIHLTDGSTQGPFTLPTVKFNLLGEWLPTHDYSANVGSFITEGGQTYIIQYPHTSAGTFDPGANDGSGHNYYGLLPFPNAPVIEFLDDGWQPNVDMGAYKLFSIPDVGVFLSLRAHHTAATFDKDATDSGNALYQEVFGAIQTNIARISYQLAGVIPGDGGAIMVYIQDDDRDLSFAANFAGSSAHLNEVCNADMSIDIKVGATVLGTITFTVGSLLDGEGGQFGTFSGPGTDTTPIASQGLLKMYAPSSSDATAKFLSVTLVGSYAE